MRFFRWVFIPPACGCPVGEGQLPFWEVDDAEWECS
jgi:hypothetical protein